MNILIITTYFPPDTAIAAVRPYMFAKYLSKMGHDITVIRSGDISKKPDDSLPLDDQSIRVYSYFGHNSPAERYKRGEIIYDSRKANRSRIWFLPYCIRSPIARLYHTIERPHQFVKRLHSTKKKYEEQKKVIDSLQSMNFDIVWSTYGELENIYAGKYAARLLGCKWILDFRDPIALRNFQGPIEYHVMQKIQDYAIRKADRCTVVSNDMKDGLSHNDNEKIITLYNGYEKSEFKNIISASASTIKRDIPKLRFCYTGSMYNGFSDASELFRSLWQLSEQGKIDLNNVVFDYAGNSTDEIIQEAAKYNVEKIIVNHGYIGRQDVDMLQRKADIFVVLSWNTELEKGVLTGKFYEGIRCAKPMLVLVTGEIPRSELLKMNQQYAYGYCYEVCTRKEHFEEMNAWIYNAYQCKMNGNSIPYSPASSLFTDFAYNNLAIKLETICKALI